MSKVVERPDPPQTGMISWVCAFREGKKTLWNFVLFFVF